MKKWSDGKAYHSVNYYYREFFGRKVYKISLDIGCTCPTRDGRKGWSGCLFCSEAGSGDFAIAASEDIQEMITRAIDKLSDKFISDDGYIGYLQSYTNTYGPVDALLPVYKKIIKDPRIVGLSIATRPDCLSNRMIESLAMLKEIKPIWLELGLQTIHQKSADWFGRAYPLEVFDQTVERLTQKDIPIIVHLIAGLKDESKEEFLASVKYVASMNIHGIKITMLHILDNSPLGQLYLKDPFEMLTEDTYIEWVCEAIANIPEDKVVYRTTGDGDKNHLIAPMWTANKRHVLNGIVSYMKKNNLYQGCWY